MTYFEILYHNCFNQKYVCLQYGETIEEVKKNFPTFNGCRMIDCKETDYQNYKRNIIKHFVNFSFSVN